MKLTGRTRYRADTKWFAPPKLVLMVEEEVLHTEFFAGWIDSKFVLHWRDARVEDLTHLLAHKCAESAPDTTYSDPQSAVDGETKQGGSL